MSYWEGKRVVVAGGAGMIGSYLCRMLVDAWVENATVCDPVPSKTPPWYPGPIESIVPSGFPFVPDVLFNLAAKVSGIGYNRLANYDMAQANLSPQMAAIDLALKWKCRLVQVSTACVYPRLSAEFLDTGTPESQGLQDEPEPTNSGYGWAKRMGEMLTMWAVREHGLDAIIVRPFNAYGPNDHFEDPNCHVIPALVKRCLRDEPQLDVWGSGNQTRAFVHASDVAKGLMLLAEKAPTGTTCNLGHNQQISISQLARLIQMGCGHNGEIVFDGEKPDGYPSRGACTTLLESLTGWKPDYPLVKGLLEVITACRKWMAEGGKEVAL